MSTPYKLGLAAAFLICAVAVGSYFLTDQTPEPADPEPAPGPELVEPDPASPPPDAADDRLAEPSPEPPPPATEPEPAPDAAAEVPSEPDDAAPATVEGPADEPDEPAAEPDAQRLAEAVTDESVPELTIGPETAEEDVDAADRNDHAPDDSLADVEAAPAEPEPGRADAPEADADADPGADDDAGTDDDAETDRAVPATHTIRRGDTFSGLAERYYGHERHWRAIAEHNPGTDPGQLRVGQEIRLPAPADLGIEPLPDDGTVLYTVRQNDTLARIAEEHYGSRDAWPTIYDANRERIGNDPDRIREGMQLRIPPAAAEEE